ncbi:MAG: hypothetical protein IKH77_06535 [Clostridia bacterium]|nr:hypothetical protein [Clostridia bacterium]
MIRKILSIALALALLCTGCFAEGEASAAPSFRSMSDPALAPYVEDTFYTGLVEALDSEEYLVENVSAVYISQEYIDELAFNSQANVYFGYTLAELDAEFQGEKYIFTLGDNNETIVVPWEEYEDPYNEIIRNVAIGTGVILICVTVSVVSGGVGAPAVSFIFAAAAKGAAVEALTGGAIQGLVAGVSTYVKTGDADQAFHSALLQGSEGFKWGAIEGAVKGGLKGYSVLKGATLSGLSMHEAALIQKETKWPLDAIKSLHSVDEYKVYEAAGLYPTKMTNGSWAFVQDINWDLVDENGFTNLQRVTKLDLAPIDQAGKSYELHHIGQKADAPLAILTHDQHHAPKTYDIIHYADEGKDISESAWRKQKQNFWKSLAYQFSGQ